MLEDLLAKMAPVLGNQAVVALKGEIDELVGESKEPWKKAVLGLVADGVTVYGPKGVQVALDAIEKLRTGDEAPNLDWADLDVCSDILAHMQNAEADSRSETREFLQKVGKVLGILFGAFLKGLLASL